MKQRAHPIRRMHREPSRLHSLHSAKREHRVAQVAVLCLEEQPVHLTPRIFCCCAAGRVCCSTIEYFTRTTKCWEREVAAITFGLVVWRMRNGPLSFKMMKICNILMFDYSITNL